MKTTLALPFVSFFLVTASKDHRGPHRYHECFVVEFQPLKNVIDLHVSLWGLGLTQIQLNSTRLLNNRNNIHGRCFLLGLLRRLWRPNNLGTTFSSVPLSPTREINDMKPFEHKIKDFPPNNKLWDQRFI